MGDSYEELLKKAYTGITEPTETGERFVVPPVKSYLEGKTTILENFSEIAQALNRDSDHFMKFMLGELGTAGKIDGSRAIFNGKFETDVLSAIVKNYIDDFVICSECGRPDTRLVKDDRIHMLRCDACGSHRPVRKRRARTEVKGTSLEEGQELEAEIESVSRRGDGVAKIGKYILYVTGGKPGQKIKVKITKISGQVAFTQRL
ncbi:MAG: translation initiation factor IF-2 subunit beta [Methanocalculus sp. MSAO_Arc1]|uniref:translation initiation factor IF-2 subunit beta n=1 Tax=Methanocalculus TaxID=71151 RepID=UPI000FED0776|nr:MULTISPECIES: translation initiation factor IF-2 subunit beta [unclassified Methanocalculus]MCP1662696.1 translation initiation factor 2 subunit 2 [Methanocalculus sp. AMF5]RQD80277.1 MAG: translation initiation factor IF-2 subunit beta [Methanocalculus sp. MSAO_Arc1]